MTPRKPKGTCRGRGCEIKLIGRQSKYCCKCGEIARRELIHRANRMKSGKIKDCSPKNFEMNNARYRRMITGSNI